MKKNKMTWVAVLLAVLLGITCGTLHAYSVASHKAQKDTFSGQVTKRPTEMLKAEFEPIREPQAYSSEEVLTVAEIVDDGIPSEVKEYAEKYGAEYCICPELIEALAYQESRFIPDVVSADGACVGICQINQKCHRARMKRLGVTDLTDAEQNIHVACDYLAEIFQEHDGDPEIVLMIYNGDSRWKNGKISRYAEEITERSMDYERLHGKRDF